MADAMLTHARPAAQQKGARTDFLMAMLVLIRGDRFAIVAITVY